MRADTSVARGGVSTARRRSGARAFARVGAVLLVLAAVTAGVVPAQAATTSTWASWTPLAGSTNDYTGSVTIAATPALSATYTSDSRSGQVGVISGDSTWLAQGTPVGAKYGSSRNQPYLNLRPRADTPTGASTTTYSFDRPTPTSNWAFVLGDIDADQVTVRAMGPNGVALTAAQLNYRGGFNYCAPGVAGKPSCTGSATDIPDWNPGSLTLTGNTGAIDTSGSAGWFEPTAPIATLTFSYQRRSGLPVYQTWFASLARDITGTVTDAATGALTGVTLRLLDPSGAVIATTTSGAGGAYSFTGVQATSGYTVEVAPPAGKTTDDPRRKPADLTSADAVVPFVLRDIVPVPVSGLVRDSDGNPIGGATVTLDGVGGPISTTTSSDGTYFFDTVPFGSHTPVLTVPSGYAQDSGPGPFTIPTGAETPVALSDFVLVAAPTLSGQVTAGADGVAGVEVTAIGVAHQFSTVTAADGTYSFPRIDADVYQVVVAVPTGYTAASPTQRTETVTTDDITGVDFALARPGSIGGSVLDGTGAGVSGATLTITGPGGPFTRTTDAAGDYSLDGLASGSYTVEVTAPSGYTIDGPASRTVTITDSGDTGVASFALAAVATPTPTPTPTSSPSPSATAVAGSGPGTGGELSDTGGVDYGPPLTLALVLAIAGAASLLTARALTARRR